MKQLLFSLVILSSIVTMKAQTMDSLFVAMPDSICTLLTAVNRADCIDFRASGMKAVVTNRFGKSSEMTDLTSDYLRLQLTSVSTVEMKKILLQDSTAVICVIKTIQTPVEDSSIAFYSTKWQLLSTDSFITLPKEQDFFVQNDSLDTAKYQQLRAKANLFFTCKIALCSKKEDLQFTFTTPAYLDKEDQKEMAAYLIKSPLVYQWKADRFTPKN